MESTGVYWKPVYAVLEGHFDLTVGNAHHIKNVPGRKTDVKDAEWIAQLVRHGLIAKSFVPPPAIRDLRELVRHRRALIETRTAARNRVLKLLEGANVKLSGVASDVFGVSGVAMLEALAAGTASASEMAGLARGRMRRKHAALEAALDGRMREHQRFLLAMQLRHLEAIDRDLDALDTRIGAHLEPFQPQHRLLMQIPGVDWVTAAAIIAEVGTDMGVFATARRLAAWAGVAPGNYESAGKPKGAAARRGNVFLKSALFAAASAAVRTKGSYYRDKYNRLRARRGPVRALMAIAHKLLLAAFHMLATGEGFRDLGESHLDQVARKRSTTKLVQRLRGLGYDVTLVPKAA
jgi:transposase